MCYALLELRMIYDCVTIKQLDHVIHDKHIKLFTFRVLRHSEAHICTTKIHIQIRYDVRIGQ